MRGAVVKRGTTYGFVLPLEPDPETGRKRQKWVGGFTTKGACEAALAEALGRAHAGTFADSGRMRVGEYPHRRIVGVGPSAATVVRCACHSGVMIDAHYRSLPQGCRDAPVCRDAG
jgi:hypothetical protein